MRNYLLAAAAAAAFATPAVAADGSGYVGIEGGVLFPKSQKGTFGATITQSAQSPAAGTAAAAPGTGLVGALPGSLATPPAAFTGGSRVKWKRGYDVDVIGGYDFGMFRLEGELGYKRSKLKRFSQDTAFGTALQTGLNPAGTTGTDFVFPNGDEGTFGLSNHVSVLSGMVNALLDIGGNGGIGAYAGGGFGRARVKELGDRDSAWAWQGIAGVNFPISPNIALGLKYRYFRTGHLNFDSGVTTFGGSTRTVAVANVPAAGGTATGTTDVTFSRTAAITGGFDDHFSSHSLLASLIFNFGAPAAAPEPVMAPPPPPPPAAPATQTCPDGSVIQATDACPAPPPPPPPPPAPTERGERGR
jgi:opacity protein-like surface antigen